MFEGKYSKALTILLIVLIVAIVIIVVAFGIKSFKSSKNDKDARQFAQEVVKPAVKKDKEEEEKPDEEEFEKPEEKEEKPEDKEDNSGKQPTRTSNIPKTKFYKSFPTVGNISIPKINLSYPILLDTSAEALELAVGVAFPSSPQFGEEGNVVIIGHNYRNGKLFSNNKKLEIGDEIKITTIDGKTITYKVYEIFETSPTDTAHYNRDTKGKAELSLSTCTDDGNNRLVIKAREK